MAARTLTLRQYDRLWRILEPTGCLFCTTRSEITAYQVLVDRGLVRWLDEDAADKDCRIAQIMPDGIRAFADFYASGRMAELGTLKPAPGGARLGMQLPAICLDPNTQPPPKWGARHKDG